MPYANLTDLIERAGESEILQIADRDDDGTADPDVIAAAIEDASTEIDGYLGVKYTLPLPSTPRLVTTWAVSIARYHLHRDGAPEHIVTDYDNAIKALDRVSRGLMVIPDIDGDQPDTTERHMSSSPAQVFTPCALRGWR
ncbi:hypothetical protein P775_11065 [Puniceibacterium antarcticum]|uniref:Mu-like prophage protein gp36 n=1 Tax=Puniceibacterium antarcticum TaxID=1206336 RepID=A0A2G8RFM7_9RHOB|nr:DUF1320 domain-containing protein [Puniceibacterium antarcticum]PIL20201.1 hypothetical protein P775_11065 [Puniceibacterium antarcticum]